MRIVIVSYPPPLVGHGGEDQISRWLADALRALGHDCWVVYEYAGAAAWRPYWPDLVVSLNSPVIAPLAGECASVFWMFNERVTLRDARWLGWRTIVTNSHAIAREHGLPILEFGCAPSQAASRDVDDSQAAPVGYVGNWHSHKHADLIERRLAPLARAGALAVWGGPGWREHPEIAPCWRGPITQDAWPALRGMARVWLNFRTPEQRAMESANCRMYAYAAAGVGFISDTPRHADFDGWCTWLDDDQWTDETLLSLARRALRPLDTAAALEFHSRNSYSVRAAELLSYAGA